MEKEKIPFNYFYQMFIQEQKKITVEQAKNQIGDIAEWMSEFFEFEPTRKELLPIYKKALYRICEEYVALANANIDVYPKDTLEFVKQILDTMEENPYKESFLMSLEFIYANYLEILQKGSPVLFSSKDEDTPPTLEIKLNKYNKIQEFEGINMDLLEENKIITEFIYMQENEIQGPQQKVHYKKRNF